MAAVVTLPAFSQGHAAPPIPQGYVFDRPGVLADQRVWGIAHGARLLGLACAKAGYGKAAEAWVEWQERESAQIEVIRAALGQYYFKEDNASHEAIAEALGLSASLNLAPEVLAPACETLSAALAQPRYDLSRRRAEFLQQ